jgi:voltage-gated potassium channel Kch
MAEPAAPSGARAPSSALLGTTSIFKLRDWILLAPFAVFAMALAVWGFLSCPAGNEHCTANGVWNVILKAFNLVRGGGDFSLEKHDPWQLIVAQFALPAVALFGAGKLLLANIGKDMRVAMARRQRNHAIVCGLGDTGRHIIEHLRDARSDVVGVTLNTEEANAIACERLGVPVLSGNAANPSILRLAGLRRARLLMLTTGSDALNIEVALRMTTTRGGRAAGAPVLYVMPEIRSHWLLELVQTHRSATLGSEAVEVRPFDLYANAARLLLSGPAFVRGTAAAAPRPHLLLAGLGEFGTQIILHAVQISFAMPGQRLAATVFDQQGEDSLASLAARFAGIAAVADLDFVETNFDAENPSSWTPVWDKVEQTLHDRDPRTETVAVIVALKNDKDALHAALQFRDRLDRIGDLRIPVFVRLREDRELGNFAASLDGADALVERLTPFGDLHYLTRPALLLDQVQDSLARGVHAGYLETMGKSGLDSGARQPWAQLPERLKQSNRRAADHFEVMLREIGMRPVHGDAPPVAFSDAQIDQLARAEHARWCIERRLLGWSYGPRANDLTRQHPDLVSWDELTDASKNLNREFVRDIPTMATAAGMALRRERIIVAVGDRLDAARDALGALGPGDQAIVVFDPEDPAGCDVARRAVTDRAARLRVLWREPHRVPRLAAGTAAAAIKAAVETSVTGAEVETLLASCRTA